MVRDLSIGLNIKSFRGRLLCWPVVKVILRIWWRVMHRWNKYQRSMHILVQLLAYKLSTMLCERNKVLHHSSVFQLKSLKMMYWNTQAITVCAYPSCSLHHLNFHIGWETHQMCFLERLNHTIIHIQKDRNGLADVNNCDIELWSLWWDILWSSCMVMHCYVVHTLYAIFIPRDRSATLLLFTLNYSWAESVKPGGALRWFDRLQRYGPLKVILYLFILSLPLFSGLNTTQSQYSHHKDRNEDQ